MPFGLCNVAQTFQCFVDEIIWGFPFVHAYIDDLLIDRETIKEHEQHLQLVFTRLSQFGIIINPAKCPFGVPTVCWEFMGIVNFHRFIPNCADTIHPQNGLLTRHGKEPKTFGLVQRMHCCFYHSEIFASRGHNAFLS